MKIALLIYFENRYKRIDVDVFKKDLITLGTSSNNDISLGFGDFKDHLIKLERENEQWRIHNESPTYRMTVNQSDKSISDIGAQSVINIENGDEVMAIIIADAEAFNGKYKRYSMKKMDEILIGSGSNCQLILNGNLVSTKHCLIRKEKECYSIENMSRNSLYINGNKVERVNLKNGDVIQIAGYELTYQGDYIGFSYSEGKTIVQNLEPISFQYIDKKPRITEMIPDDDIEIEEPTVKPSKPVLNFTTVVLPSLMMIIVMSGISLLTKYYTMMLYTIPMSGVTLMVSFLSHGKDKKKYKETIKVRIQKYKEFLDNKRKEIEAKQNIHISELNKNHPEVSECMTIVKDRNERIWVRSNRDEDFLETRIGKGRLKSSLTINVPRDRFELEDDDLRRDAQKIQSDFQMLENVPICLKLAELDGVGFVGEKVQLLDTLRAMITQLTTNHDNHQLKLACVFDEGETYEWEIMRWMPHVWDDERTRRFMAKESSNKEQLTSFLGELIRQRSEEYKNASGEAERKQDCHYIIFSTDKNFLKQYLFGANIESYSKLGITFVFLGESLQELPHICREIVFLNGKKSYIQTKKGQRIRFTPDDMTMRYFREYIENLSPLKMNSLMLSEGVPQRVTFMEMYESNKVDDISVLSNWRNNKTYKSIEAPMGIKGNSRKMNLDMHEKGHGTIALIAGKIGSGKSELLQSLILSQCIEYSPQELAYVFIDYKGGSTSNLFAKLPHVAGSITNLDGKKAHRAMMSIKAELLRRQRIFNKYDVRKLDDYQKLYYKGIVQEAIPHLILVIDEFAEMKKDNPEFMKELITAVNTGRSLGFHLIIATQNPTNCVDEDIWRNTKIKICLSVDAEASQAILKRGEAARIRNVGRAYLQVGNNEIFELFQSAYSGATYKETLERELTDEIFLVNLDGSLSSPFAKELSSGENEVNDQLTEMIEHIKIISEENDIERTKQLWKDELPVSVELEVEEAYEEKVSAPLGVVDDPRNQRYVKWFAEFEKNGHMLIAGGPSSGKTMGLQTVVTSLVKRYSSQWVNIYCLDFGGRTLSVFEDLPHVGDVVYPDDEEKLSKFTTFIYREMERRKYLFNKARVSNYSAYKTVSKEPLPSIFIVLDNYAATRDMDNGSFGSGESISDKLRDFFTIVTREGMNSGIYFVGTTDQVSAVPFKILNNIKMKIALHMDDKSDYSTLVGRTNGLEHEDTPGRGLVRLDEPLEIQMYMPIAGEVETDRIEKMKDLISELKMKNEVLAQRIPILPKTLSNRTFEEGIKVDNPLEIPIGIEEKTLSPVSLNLDTNKHYILSGGFQTGKTNLMRMIISQLISNFTREEVNINIIDSPYGEMEMFKGCDQVVSYEYGFDACEGLTQMLRETVESAKQRMVSGSQSLETKQFVFINGVDTFGECYDDEFKALMEKIVKKEKRAPIYVFVSGGFDEIEDYSTYGGSFIEMMVKIKNLILMGDLNNPPSWTNIYNSRAAEVPRIGMGTVVVSGRTQNMLVPLYSDEMEVVEDEWDVM